MHYVCGHGTCLLIVTDVTFKMAAWPPYWNFWFPDSNFSLALNIKSKLHWHITSCVYGKKPIDFQQCHFQNGCLAAIVGFRYQDAIGGMVSVPGRNWSLIWHFNFKKRRQATTRTRVNHDPWYHNTTRPHRIKCWSSVIVICYQYSRRVLSFLWFIKHKKNSDKIRKAHFAYIGNNQYWCYKSKLFHCQEQRPIHNAPKLVPVRRLRQYRDPS